MRHVVYRREVFEIVPGLRVEYADAELKLTVDPTPGDGEDGGDSGLAVSRRLGAVEAAELGRVLGKLARMCGNGAGARREKGALQATATEWVRQGGDKPFGTAALAAALEVDRTRANNIIPAGPKAASVDEWVAQLFAIQDGPTLVFHDVGHAMRMLGDLLQDVVRGLFERFWSEVLVVALLQFIAEEDGPAWRPAAIMDWVAQERLGEVDW